MDLIVNFTPELNEKLNKKFNICPRPPVDGECRI